MTGLDPVAEYGSEKTAAWYVYLFVAIVLAIAWMPGWIAWIFTRETREPERDPAKDEPQKTDLRANHWVALPVPRRNLL